MLIIPPPKFRLHRGSGSRAGGAAAPPATVQVLEVFYEDDTGEYVWVFDTEIESTDSATTGLFLDPEGVDEASVDTTSPTSLILDFATHSDPQANWRVTPPVTGVTFVGGKLLGAQSGAVG